MQRMICRAKIHRAVVSEVAPDYVGSMTIPRDIMKALDILEGERVEVANIQTGARWTTYAIASPKPGHFCLNGAAARNGQVGDLIIIMIFAGMEEAQARRYRMKIALMGPDNSVEKILEQQAGAV